MNKLTLYQIDSFATELFKGNPAAVCILEEWLPDELMQKIGNENNLSETAFVVPKGEDFEIRWFTPNVEVDLCGHATLAAAFVLYNYGGIDKSQGINFHSKSGPLNVSMEGDKIVMDFPKDVVQPYNDLDLLAECLGIKPKEALSGKTDILAIFDSEETILNIQPDFAKVAQLDRRGVIISAPGNTVDFVSRFFAPQCDVPEDPVTGSAHTTLTPYWSERLAKKQLTAKQISKRGGDLLCEDAGERVIIKGNACLYMKAEIL